MMSCHNDVTHQMEKIRSTFQHALQISTMHDDEMLLRHPESIHPEFRSVAYEGIAMGLALKDFAEGSLHRWRAFLRSANPIFSTHIHIGLGWAIGKKKIPSLIFLSDMKALSYAKVVDGIGYYDATFKKVLAVNGQIVPSYLEKKDLRAYDQGIGRALWYSCNGKIEKVKQAIISFNVNRQGDMWRGIGIASTFVGACDDAMLNELKTSASDHTVQLAIGASIVAKGRIQTNTSTSYAEKACGIWCNESLDHVYEIVSNAERKHQTSNGNYNLWLTIMESELSKGILNLF